MQPRAPFPPGIPWRPVLRLHVPLLLIAVYAKTARIAVDTALFAGRRDPFQWRLMVQIEAGIYYAAGVVLLVMYILHRRKKLPRWLSMSKFALAVFAVVLSLKTLRNLGMPEYAGMRGALGLLDLHRSEVCFYAAVALAWAALLGALTQLRFARARGAAFAAMRALALALVFTESAALAFYNATGSPLDFSLTLFFFTNFGGLAKLVAPELTVSLFVVGFLALAFWRYDRVSPAAANDAETPAAAPRSPSFLLEMTVAMVAAALFTLALLPSMLPDHPYSRTAPLHLLVTAVAEYRDASDGQAHAAPVAPAHLVARDDAKKRNVAIVLLESTREMSTTLGNPGLATTPFLLELAKNGLVADDAYAVVTHSSKAVIAVACGSEPRLRLPITESYVGGVPMRCLPAMLRDQGYRTTYFQSTTEKFEGMRQVLANTGTEDPHMLEDYPKAGFNAVNVLGYEDEIMLGPSEDWLKKGGATPFMAIYSTLAAHYDYEVPARYPREKFAENDEVDRYLNCIRYSDHFLEKLFEQYKRLGLLDDTIFVVVGDHGQGFGEHGRWQHADDIYEDGIHVPLVVWDPKNFAGGTHVTAPVSQLDIVPTIADLLGYKIEGGIFPGTSMRAIPAGRSIRVSCWLERRCMAEITGSHKVIDHFDDRSDELFDVNADPGETHDLAGKFPGEVRRARDDLQKWRADVNARYGSLGR